MKIIIGLLLCCYCFQSFAVQNTDFPESYRSAHFILYYASRTGVNQLPEQNQVDKTPQNGIPDFIEAIAKQLETAYALYTGPDFKLQPPLSSDRYMNKASYIGVYIKKFKSGNGATSDEIQEDHNGYPILRIELSNALSSTNLTPAHELFHIFQNSYSMMKNAWFLEGSARWVENAFREIEDIDSSVYQKTLPQSELAFETLAGLSYNADYFWNRLSYLCDPASPKNNARAPLKSIYGLKLMKAVLDNLEIQSDRATRDRCYSYHQWPEGDQKYNSDNLIYMLHAIQQAIITQCPSKQLQTRELDNFLQAIDHQIERSDRTEAYFDSETQRVYLPRVSVLNHIGTDSLLKPTAATNTFKVILDLIPDTNPARFSVRNSTPQCNSITQETSATYQSNIGLLRIPLVALSPFGSFQVDLTQIPNQEEFELKTINYQ